MNVVLKMRSLLDCQDYDHDIVILLICNLVGSSYCYFTNVMLCYLNISFLVFIIFKNFSR